MLSFEATEQRILFEIGTAPKIASDKPDEAHFGTRGGLEPQGWVLWLFQNPIIERQTIALVLVAEVLDRAVLIERLERLVHSVR